MMFPKNTKLIRLEAGKKILSFDCGDEDLNNFLHNDSHHYQSQLLAVTYLLVADMETIAFFSLLNDKISITDIEDHKQWRKKFKDTFPHGKRFKSYPAVKIGRLAVSDHFKSAGTGTAILDYIKFLFVNNNRTGCKYITVDAYAQSLTFYEKNGFSYMTDKDVGSDTRLMYFPLSRIA